MSPRVLVLFCLLITVFLITGLVHAQQGKKVPRIGYLTLLSRPGIREKAFVDGLRELGYIERKNIVIEFRFAAGKTDRLPALVTELVHLKVDVFVTAANPPAQAAKEWGGGIPIVMAGAGDPIATGLVDSLARPGGNITGSTVYSSELTGKRLEIIKEVVPRASRIGVLASRRDVYLQRKTFGEVFLRETSAAAKEIGLLLSPQAVRDPSEFEGAFAAMAKDGARALLVQAAPIFNDDPQRVVDLATKHRLPGMFEIKEFAEVGGLMSYGPDRERMFRRAATYVDKILKGAKPAELPVEQPTKLEFVINLKAAKQIGLTIPPNVLARADKVIK
jgi:putative ABC transport system substrate-binding protein